METMIESGDVATSQLPRPDSPCRGVCTTLFDAGCKGCGRHFLEVSKWNGLTAEEREPIWVRLQQEGWVDENGQPTSKGISR